MPALGMQATPYNACWECRPLPIMPAWFSFVDSVSVFPLGAATQRLSPTGIFTTGLSNLNYKS